jgi:hypothetical protein
VPGGAVCRCSCHRRLGALDLRRQARQLGLVICIRRFFLSGEISVFVDCRLEPCLLPLSDRTRLRLQNR